MQAEKGSQVGICIDLAEPTENPAEVKPNQCFSRRPGLPAGCPWEAVSGLVLLTSTQEQILDLLEGFADSWDAAWAGLVEILKGQKRHRIRVAQRSACNGSA